MDDMKITLTDTTITVKDRFSENTFQLVDEVPLGYMVWNIGKHMAPGYPPLCRMKYLQPFYGAQQIETDTLKAIKVDGAEYVMKAVSWAGPLPVEQMERYIEEYRDSKDECDQYQIELFQKAIPVMKKIKWIRPEVLL